MWYLMLLLANMIEAQKRYGILSGGRQAGRVRATLIRLEVSSVKEKKIKPLSCCFCLSVFAGPSLSTD